MLRSGFGRRSTSAARRASTWIALFVGLMTGLCLERPDKIPQHAMVVAVVTVVVTPIVLLLRRLQGEPPKR